GRGSVGTRSKLHVRSRRRVSARPLRLSGANRHLRRVIATRGGHVHRRPPDPRYRAGRPHPDQAVPRAAERSRIASAARGDQTSARTGGAALMQVAIGLIFVALGATCIGYLWAGGSVFDREPPLLVLGVLLIVLTAALAGRARAAGLLARAALGAAIVAIAWLTVRYL